MMDELELQISDPVGGEDTALEEKAEVAPIENPDFEIAGFWWRFLGGVIDWVILAMICLVIKLLMGRIPYQIGDWGRYIGLAVGTLYLGILNSEVNGGRSPGKRATRTILVGADNKLLPIGKSILRGGLLSLACIGAGLGGTIPIVGSILGFVSFIGLIWLGYGIIFNRTTRQGPHDLIMKSYVIHAPALKYAPLADATPPKNRVVHFHVPLGCSGMFILATVGMIVLGAVLTTIIFPDQVSAGQEIDPVLESLITDLEGDDLIHDASAGWISGGRTQSGEPIIAELKVELRMARGCFPAAPECVALSDRVIADIRSRDELREYGYRRIRLEIVSDIEFGWLFWRNTMIFLENR